MDMFITSIEVTTPEPRMISNKGSSLSDWPQIQTLILVMVRAILLVSVAIALVTSASIDTKANKCSHQFRPPFFGGCICLPEGGPCPKSKALKTDEIAQKTEELESLVRALFPSDARAGCTHQFRAPWLWHGTCICLPEGGPC